MLRCLLSRFPVPCPDGSLFPVLAPYYSRPTSSLVTCSRIRSMRPSTLLRVAVAAAAAAALTPRESLGQQPGFAGVSGVVHSSEAARQGL